MARLRGFTPGDLNGISVEERRNLRIELLDFMMRSNITQTGIMI